MNIADLRYESRDSVVCASLRGEVDMSVSEELLEVLRDLTPNDAHGLILDLTDVDYVDSTGIHLIHRLRDGLRTRGQGFRLVIPEQSLISDTLRLAGVDRSDEITQTVDEARAALRPESADG